MGCLHVGLIAVRNIKAVKQGGVGDFFGFTPQHQPCCKMSLGVSECRRGGHSRTLLLFSRGIPRWLQLTWQKLRISITTWRRVLGAMSGAGTQRTMEVKEMSPSCRVQIPARLHPFLPSSLFHIRNPTADYDYQQSSHRSRFSGMAASRVCFPLRCRGASSRVAWVFGRLPDTPGTESKSSSPSRYAEPYRILRRERPRGADLSFSRAVWVQTSQPKGGSGVRRAFCWEDLAETCLPALKASFFRCSCSLALVDMFRGDTALHPLRRLRRAALLYWWPR